MTSPEEHPDPDPLAELEAELDPGPAAPLFDEHGLPTGRLGAGVWTELLTRMEAVLEEGGWDAPPTLHALAGPVQTLARFHPEALERFQEHLVNLGGTTGAPTGPHGPVATPFSIVPLGQVEGPPVDHLWGFTAPEWAAAVIMAFEAWSSTADSPFSARPSTDPLRQEMRAVHMITRSGDHFVVSRVRGRDPQVHDGTGPTRWDGFLPDVLRRTLGLPVRPHPGTVGDLLGRHLLTFAIGGLGRVLGHPGDQGQDEKVPQAVLEGREELARMSQEERAAVVESMTYTQAVVGLSRLTYLATEGAHGLTSEQATLVRSVSQGNPDVVADRAALHRLTSAARAAAGRSWMQIATGHQSQQLLPEQARHDPHWAGKDLLAAYMLDREMATQEELRARLEQIVGRGPVMTLTELLRASGWGPSPAG